jgi:hypothetical protein
MSFPSSTSDVQAAVSISQSRVVEIEYASDPSGSVADPQFIPVASVPAHSRAVEIDYVSQA